MVKLFFCGFGFGFGFGWCSPLSNVWMYLSEQTGFGITRSVKVYIDFSVCGGRLITINYLYFFSFSYFSCCNDCQEFNVLIHFGVSGPCSTFTSNCSISFIKSFTLAIFCPFFSSRIGMCFSCADILPFITVQFDESCQSGVYLYYQPKSTTLLISFVSITSL